VREILILAIPLLVTLAKLLRPGGVRAVAAESLLLKHQFRISNRSRDRRRKPGPKGPSAELIATIVELKRRNPRVGYVRSAQQISHAFGVDIDLVPLC
jgi:hypothetical protein